MNAKILIVDDEKDIVLMLSRFFCKVKVSVFYLLQMVLKH